MRDLLFLSYFYPPLGGAGVQRSLKFTRYLPEFGWRPTVVTGPASYWIQDDTLLAEVSADLRIVRAPQWGSGFFGAGKGASGGRSRGHVSVLRSVARSVLLPDAYVGWAIPAGRRAESELRAGTFSAVLTTSSPDSTHLIGLNLRRKFDLPWVADFRDPWTERMSFAPPTPVHHRLHRWLERQVLEHADAILVTSSETKDSFLTLAPKLLAEKIHVITNGFDEADFSHPSGSARSGSAGIESKSSGGGAICAETSGPRQDAPILHAGQLNPERPLDPFLAGLGRFLERSPERAAEVRTLFLGAHYDQDRTAVEEHDLEDHVVFAGNCPHHESVDALCRARILLLLEQDSDRGRLILPGKVFEYLRAGRPILAVVPKGGAADHLVSELSAGRVVDPSRPDEVAEGIEFLLDQREFRPPRVERFERRELTRELAQVLDGCDERK